MEDHGKVNDISCQIYWGNEHIVLEDGYRDDISPTKQDTQNWKYADSGVSMCIESIIPKEIIADSVSIAKIGVTNKSADNILISNIPSMECDYKIFKEIDGKYVSIDSSCIDLRDPILPAEGLQDMPFKKGQAIICEMVFPPLCIISVAGNYKIKLSFTYYTKDFQAKTIESDNYQFQIIRREALKN